MLEKIKKSIRITHDRLDEEIQRNIDTCLLDMKRVGINTSDSESNMIIKACELFCKWQFDFMGKAERYKICYEQFRDSMSLSKEYQEAENGSEL